MPKVGPSRQSSRGSGQLRRHATGRTSLVEQAYLEIRSRILDNRYAPGQQVLELELAADLGISRTPVREKRSCASRMNASFRSFLSRHGVRVVPMSIEDLREVYEVLTSLELTAVERLARTQLSPGDLTAIEKKRTRLLVTPTTRGVAVEVL